jgi:hypothetical protein
MFANISRHVQRLGELGLGGGDRAADDEVQGMAGGAGRRY